MALAVHLASCSTENFRTRVIVFSNRGSAAFLGSKYNFYYFVRLNYLFNNTTLLRRINESPRISAWSLRCSTPLSSATQFDSIVHFPRTNNHEPTNAVQDFLRRRKCAKSKLCEDHIFLWIQRWPILDMTTSRDLRTLPRQNPSNNAFHSEETFVSISILT